MVQRRLARTKRRLSMVQRRLATTERLLVVVQRRLATTKRLLAMTERPLAAIERRGGWAHILGGVYQAARRTWVAGHGQ